MKKYLFLVAILLLTISMALLAQNYNNRRGANNNNNRSGQIMRITPQERVDLMTKELDLTAEQTSQVLALCEKQEIERKALVKENRIQRAMGAETRAARRDEFRALRDKQMKEQYVELEKIIGKEKADKWNEFRQDVRKGNRTGRRNSQCRNR